MVCNPHKAQLKSSRILKYERNYVRKEPEYLKGNNKILKFNLDKLTDNLDIKIRLDVNLMVRCHKSRGKALQGLLLK